MPLTLLLGGARSGKSDLAQRLALAQPAPVTLIATGQPHDAEMAQRIGRHRAERPSGWTTIEEPLDLEGAIAAAVPETCLIVDCLTLWVANLQAGEADAQAITTTAARAAQAACARPGPTIAVSNEVGLGIVPANELARAYRDLLGRVNTTWAAGAAAAYLLVAGRALALGPAPALPAGIGA